MFRASGRLQDLCLFRGGFWTLMLRTLGFSRLQTGFAVFGG